MTRDKLNQSLIDASAQGDAEEVKSLIKLGADVHAWDSDALRSASKHGQTGVVELLLEAGANIHAGDDYALRMASLRGHTEVVKLLLKSGADVHACDDIAMQLASLHGRTEVVKLLSDWGARQKNQTPPPDQISHPKHYTAHPSGIECIQITQHMGFCLGNAVKYIWRADLKGDAIADLKKARQFIDFEITKREGAKNG